MQKVSYMGNGSTTEFNFNFPYFDNTNIIVTKNNQSATGYTIIGTSAGLDADIPYTGGKVVFDVAPTSLDNITIARSLPLTRTVDYQPTAKLEPTTLNQDMNYMMELLKDQQDELDYFKQQYADITNNETVTTLLTRIANLSQQITNLGDISQIRSNITTLNTLTNGLSDYVIESQIPTQSNGYKWYRKYKSGWVEQGGDFTGGGTTVTLPVTMADTHYSVASAHTTSESENYVKWQFMGIEKTTTSVTIRNNGTAQSWFVCGMAA